MRRSFVVRGAFAALVVASTAMLVAGPTQATNASESAVTRPTPITANGPAARAVVETENETIVPAGGTLRVPVRDAVGGKTVIGQLTVDRAFGAGYVTAYPCSSGPPRDASGGISRSDLNVDASVTRVASNRLIVKADDAGEVCFYTSIPTALIVDVNATSFDTGINSFANRRTDTRGRPNPIIAAGATLRVNVPEAAGGRTVIGQLTVDRARGAGFVTAYPCASGPPRDANGSINRSDLNVDAAVSPVASNRLIVQADGAGDICFTPSIPTALIVDVNGVTGDGITGLANRRTDTRARPNPIIGAGGTLRVTIPEAAGGQTVIGQLTVDRARGAGFVTAYPCAAGPPRDINGGISRSDLNVDAAVSPVASNRLVVQADGAGDICFTTSNPAALIVDINGLSTTGIDSFPNRRTDTRDPNTSPDDQGTPIGAEVPTWPAYSPRPALAGTAALTGLSAPAAVTNRPIVAVKIDNFRAARPPWGLEWADAVIEENIEGVTRFIALYHTHLPDTVGPVRSARIADLDLVFAMNRPVLSYSGANDGVNAWIRSAAGSGLLVDYPAARGACYSRSDLKPGPHNLLVDTSCATARGTGAGPATALWPIDRAWAPSADSRARNVGAFTVKMDGVTIDWAWDPGSGRYLRSQSGEPHVTMSGARVTADNVVVMSVVHVASPVDARSPNPITTGTGNAVVHRDGRAVDAIWSRATATDPFSLFERATGLPIRLDTGVTFMHLTRA